MIVKASLLGLMIYIALFGYSLASLASSFKLKKLCSRLFVAGFIFNILAIAIQWITVERIPMQTMFELFLWLSALVYPLSLFTRNYLNNDSTELDILISIFLIFPAAFVFDSEPSPLPPALQSWHFGPHVGSYMLGYVLIFKAAACSTKLLLSKQKDYLSAAKTSHHLVCLGFMFITAGLVLGSMWAKVSWGRFWGWDPKELWSLATWLVFTAYFISRYRSNTIKSKTPHIITIIGFVFIIITLLWVNLSKSFDSIHNYAS